MAFLYMISAPWIQDTANLASWFLKGITSGPHVGFDFIDQVGVPEAHLGSADSGQRTGAAMG
jgi:hypothetical protein